MLVARQLTRRPVVLALTVGLAFLGLFAVERKRIWPDSLEPLPVRDVSTQRPCSSNHPAFDNPFAGPYWNGWGAGLNNSRSQPANMAGLSKNEVPRLKLKWAFGVPGVEEMVGQPAVAGGRLFFGSASGKVYSIDAKSACTYWVFDAGARVRTAITIGPAGDRWAAWFGDNDANGAHAYALDAATGRLIWKSAVDDSGSARITGAAVFASGRLYVPVTGNEDAKAGDPAFACCKLQGSLVSLDAATGRRIWKSYTIAQPARAFRKNSHGVWQWGPSGAGIWSAPTVDPVKHAVYVGTGDSHSDPAVPTSDAILAFGMETGELLWSRQMTPGDGWNFACVEGDPANCPTSHGGDLDFGSSPILVDLPGGKRALIAGQKSGVVYAIDPDAQGKVLWQTRVGNGGMAGGIQWGPSADAQNVYVALSDVGDVFPVPARASAFDKFGWFLRRVDRLLMSDDGGGTFALRLNTGERVWYTPPQCDWTKRCRPGQVAAVTNIPGVVFSGSVDGHMRAYSTDDGRVIWNVGTASAWVTVNGVRAHGGAIGGPGPVVVGGVLYVNSGYVTVPRGQSGNVLLAFSVDGK